jgi:hypothetical protein
MFETKKLFVIGLATLALACNKEKVCNDDIDDNENGLIDCADVEQCGADPACAVTADADTGAVRNFEADIANGNVAFEAITVNIGINAAAFAAVMSDQADTCALLTGAAVAADAKIAVIIGLDTTQADPKIAFASGTTFVGDGATKFVIAAAQVIQAGAVVANSNSEATATFDVDKLGADGFSSASVISQLTQDITVEAEFDTDANNDGVNDFLAIAPVDISANFTNATNCPGLANVLLGL